MSAAPAANGWPAAATALARRATRRRRTSAFLVRAAAGTVAGAAVLAAARLTGAGPVALPEAALATGALVGAVLGLRAARRVAPTTVGDAAWALDRVGAAGGRGLAAALVGGPAADAAGRSGPPPVARLEAPDGLPFALAAVLLAVGACTVPRRTADDAGPGATTPSAGTARGGAAVDAGRADAYADAQARRAAAERAVREALALPRTGPVDPTEVAQRLRDPAVRAAARRSAAEGSEAAAALSMEGADGAAALARALSDEAAARAEALRRRATAGRAEAGAAVVPPSRRDLVARYLATRLVPESPPR